MELRSTQRKTMAPQPNTQSRITAEQARKSYTMLPQTKTNPQTTSKTEIESNVRTTFEEPLDMSIYPAPQPLSPLGKQLSKLMPPNDQSVNFFNNLFQ